MRSELVNRIKISQWSQILLRAMIEHAAKSNIGFPEKSKYEIVVPYVFIDSMLSFKKGVCAVHELHNEELIHFDYRTGNCTLLLLHVLKAVKYATDTNTQDTDYIEACALLSQMESHSHSVI